MENMEKDLNKNNEVAISVANISKTFKIPHEKITSVKGAVTGLFSSSRLPFLGGGQGGGSSYEEFKVLDDVSFEVRKKGFFVILTSTLQSVIISALKPPVLTFWHGGVFL